MSLAEEGLADKWIDKISQLVLDACDQFDELQRNVKNVRLQFKMPAKHHSSFSFAFVDGGSGYVDLAGGSIYFIRAAGAFFKNPDKPIWESDVGAGFTILSRNVDRFVGIERDILEIQTAIELLQYKPDMIVMDNSLASYAGMGVPYSILHRFQDPRPDGSPEFQYFNRFVTLMKRFDALITECLLNDILLVGITKDPRSRGYAKNLQLGNSVMDITAVSLIADGQVGFTPEFDSQYIRIDRIEEYLKKHKILTDNRGDFMTCFCILSPKANPFKIDYLKSQKNQAREIREMIVSLHDGSGYLLPSHIVHDHATISSELAEGLTQLVLKRTAERNMRTAETILRAQRRSRFG